MAGEEDPVDRFAVAAAWFRRDRKTRPSLASGRRRPVKRAAGGRSVEELDFARGDLLARTDRVVEAEQAFRAEIAAFPDRGRAYASLAVLLWVSGNRSAARSILEQHMRTAPGSRSIELAAKTIDALGDHATATEWRKKKKSPGVSAGASIIR